MRANERVSFRELFEPLEVVEALRLRHRIYFEEQQYGPGKTLRLDLTAHDARSRLFGVFRGASLVGGIRLVLRRPQPLAPLFRGLRAVAEADPEDTSTGLPSEEAFDVGASVGAARELVDGEIGRFALDAGALGPWLAHRAIIASLAAARREGCRLYLYSCAITVAKAYARVTNPRFVLAQHVNHGIASDGFMFPKATLAAVASVEDSPYASLIDAYAADLRERGEIDLSASVVRAQAAAE